MLLYQRWTRSSRNIPLCRVHVRGFADYTMLPRYRHFSSSTNIAVLGQVAALAPTTQKSVIRVLRYPRCVNVTYISRIYQNNTCGNQQQTYPRILRLVWEYHNRVNSAMPVTSRFVRVKHCGRKHQTMVGSYSPRDCQWTFGRLSLR